MIVYRLMKIGYDSYDQRCHHQKIYDHYRLMLTSCNRCRLLAGIYLNRWTTDLSLEIVWMRLIRKRVSHWIRLRRRRQTLSPPSVMVRDREDHRRTIVDRLDKLFFVVIFGFSGMIVSRCCDVAVLQPTLLLVKIE